MHQITFKVKRRRNADHAPVPTGTHLTCLIDFPNQEVAIHIAEYCLKLDGLAIAEVTEIKQVDEADYQTPDAALLKECFAVAKQKGACLFPARYLTRIDGKPKISPIVI